MEPRLTFCGNVFTFIFAGEAVLKLFAELPPRYFRGGWNQYDFFVVVVTVSEYIYTVISGPDSEEIPGVAILRVFRIARIFRLLRKMKGLSDLFLSVLHALPTIINVGSVLGLIFFIYAVLGMHLFGKIKRGENLNEHANFETFTMSLLTVFRMSTGESWNAIMNDCQISPPDCDMDVLKNCGTPVAIPYFVSFQIVGQFVMLNLFIAVILEYYQREMDSTIPYLKPHDYEDFEDIWTQVVGRDQDNEPYGPFKVMPLELFEGFMDMLPERIGFSKRIRDSLKAKLREVEESAISELPIRYQQILVRRPENKTDPACVSYRTYLPLSRFWSNEGTLSTMPDDALHIGVDAVTTSNEPNEAHSGTGKALGTGQFMKRSADQLKAKCKQADLNSEGTKSELAESEHETRAAKATKGLDSAAQAGEETEEEDPWGEGSSEIGHDDTLMDAELGTQDSAPVRTKPQTQTALMKVYYVHISEVWHCLYNRAEAKNLLDSENEHFFNNEAGRKRQVLQHLNIMESTANRLAHRISTTTPYKVTRHIRGTSHDQRGIWNAIAIKSAQRTVKKWYVRHVQEKEKRARDIATAKRKSDPGEPKLNLIRLHPCRRAGLHTFCTAMCPECPLCMYARVVGRMHCACTVIITHTR